MESTTPNGKLPSRPDTPVRERQKSVGEWNDAIQYGRQGAKPNDIKPIGTGLYGSGSESGSRLIHSNLNFLAVNVRGIMCHGRSEQARLLMIKHKASIAILSETETTHSYSRQPIWRVLGLSAPLKLLLDPLVRKLESS